MVFILVPGRLTLKCCLQKPSNFEDRKTNAMYQFIYQCCNKVIFSTIFGSLSYEGCTACISPSLCFCLRRVLNDNFGKGVVSLVAVLHRGVTLFTVAESGSSTVWFHITKHHSRCSRSSLCYCCKKTSPALLHGSATFSFNRVSSFRASGFGSGIENATICFKCSQQTVRGDMESFKYHAVSAMQTCLALLKCEIAITTALVFFLLVRVQCFCGEQKFLTCIVVGQLKIDSSKL